MKRVGKKLQASLVGGLLLMLMSFIPSCSGVSADKDPGPNAGQRAMIARKYGMFLHYGINTYLGVEWSDGQAPASRYAPPADIAQKAASWVRNARRAGMRSIVLTVKHHDGFCLWDSRYTDYDVMHPDVENKVDIVRVVSDACRDEGIAFSIYYSLWDRHEASYRDKDPYSYIRFMKNQLQELMTGYGPVSELWFDGAWDRKIDDWYLQEVYDFVKSLQPACQIAVNHTIGKRPVDMRRGDTIKYFPADFRLWDPYLPMADDNKIYLHNGKKYYLPYETTQTISVLGNWFSNPADTTVRDVEELEEIFHVATANDNCLLLNVPPGMDGAQRPAYVDRITELADRLGIRDGKPFPPSAKLPASRVRAHATSVWGGDTLHWGAQYAVDSDVSTAWQGDSLATLTLHFPQRRTFRTVSVITGRGSIHRYGLEACRQGEWHCFHRGDIDPEKEPASFMGYGFINLALEESIEADSLRITIAESNGKPQIYSIRLKE